MGHQRAPGRAGHPAREGARRLTAIAELPYIDEHATTIAASTDDVWAALLKTTERTFESAHVRALGRAIGTRERADGPRPLTEGSTLTGFRVAAAVPRSELALQGSHRFSDYALLFHLEEAGPRRTCLTAESRATFPGRVGGLYRLLVIGTRGHVVAVRRVLSAVKRRAERG